MKKNSFLIFLLVTFIVQAQEHKTDSSLFTFIYLESGDMYIGKIISQSDTAWVVNEKNLGGIILHPKEVKKIESVFYNSSIQLFLSDNSKYSGKLIEINDNNYIIETLHTGIIKIPENKVTKITNLDKNRAAPNNTNSTRYFFAPSAIPLEKNGGYYQNAYLLSNSINFGLTHNFTLGGGVIIPMLFYITPKISFEVRKNFYLGAGVLAATTLIPDAIVSGGIPYGLATIGNTENNITLGSGYGLMWNNGDFEHTHYPITVVNGMARISKRIHLLSENWIVPFKRQIIIEGYYDNNNNWVEEVKLDSMHNKLYMALSLGMRIMIGERSTVDFAPVFLYHEKGIVLPYLDFVYAF